MKTWMAIGTASVLFVSASAYAVGASLIMRPAGVTYSETKARLLRSARSRDLAAA